MENANTSIMHLSPPVTSPSPALLLSQISEMLLLNGTLVDCPGLLHGKTGIAIFFFHYAQQTDNELFADYAIELIDKIQLQIHLESPVDYERGLAGIGVGIEYLAQNGFLDIDTDEVLEDIDKRIFRALIGESTGGCGLSNGLSGLGRYFLMRISNQASNKNKISTLTNQQLLIHIVDMMASLLSTATEDELDDAIQFLRKVDQSGIYPVKTGQVLGIYPNISVQNTGIKQWLTSGQQDFMEKGFNEGDRFSNNIIPKKERYRPEMGIHDGYSGIGLHLLGILDKQHIIWNQLL